MLNSFAFRFGDMHPSVVLMGACPGKQEEAQGRPFAGSAGANLRIMLTTLHAARPDVFSSDVLEDYTLLNAHDLPRYKGRPGFDGKTTPPKKDIQDPANIDRLEASLTHVEASHVIFLGKDALNSLEALTERLGEISYLKLGHPSPMAWNPRPEYRGLSKPEKLARWAIDSWVQL